MNKPPGIELHPGPPVGVPGPTAAIVHDRYLARTNKHELMPSPFSSPMTLVMPSEALLSSAGSTPSSSLIADPRADRRVIGRGMGDEEVGPRRSGGHT